ncbi:MAG: thiolase family protein [Pseudomonadota bacterium]
MPQDYSGVALVCPVTIPYEKRSDRSAAWWIGRALKALIDAAGITKSDIDGFAATSFTLHPDTSVGLIEHYCLSPRVLEWIPTGGASGVMAIRRAARAIQAGDADIVACVAGDTNNADSFKGILENFSRFSTQAVLPYGGLGPNGVFAMIMRQYMEAFGATREDIGRLAVMQRANGATNPLALLKGSITLDDYIEARPIAEPVHLLDCVMPCAGADGLLVMSTDRAKSLGLPWARIDGIIERHNAFPGSAQILQTGHKIDAANLWEQANAGPGDMDFLQTYDDYPVISMMQMEALGFCAEGEAKTFVAETDMTLTGALPHNTSGGQLAMGQAGAAGGYVGLVDAVRQLTHQPLGPQIDGVRKGCVMGYGMVNYDRGLCTSAAVLSAGERP